MNKIKIYAFFILYLLSRPHLLLLIIKKIYLPVYIQYEWIRNYNIKTFIDVGANQGKVSRVIQYFFPSATIYAFEPMRKEFENLKKIFISPQIIINNLALSNSVGKTEFYINNHAPSSSILKISKNGKRIIPALSKYHKITVNQTTMDNYFKNRKLKGFVFLKIDVQGTEHLVLNGSINSLKKVDLIHIETSFKDIYENQSLFPEIYDFLTNHGFRYLGSVKDSDFYPLFQLSIQENSIFINKRHS